MAVKMQSARAGINDINITPFVDIVLVLLIVFMISTPAMVARGLRVSLPQARNSEDMSYVTLNLVLNREGNLYLDGKTIDTNRLKEIVLDLKAKKTSSDAVISADKDVAHGKVMEVSDALRSLGVEQVGFAAVPKK